MYQHLKDLSKQTYNAWKNFEKKYYELRDKVDTSDIPDDFKENFGIEDSFERADSHVDDLQSDIRSISGGIVEMINEIE